MVVLVTATVRQVLCVLGITLIAKMYCGQELVRARRKLNLGGAGSELLLGLGGVELLPRVKGGLRVLPWSRFVINCASLLCAGDGIRCYVCNSKQDARCLDPFSSNLTALDTVDCERDNSVRAALETVANLMTRLGQAPARDSTDPLSQASQTPPAAPASCQKIDLRGNIMYKIIIY